MANRKQVLIDMNELCWKVDESKYNNPHEGILRVNHINEHDHFLHIILDSPIVDAVEVVHARWKNGDCTACGFDIRDMIDGESEFYDWVWEGLPYCPICGAKMDGDTK